jgi:hypothetical protein
MGASIFIVTNFVFDAQGWGCSQSKAPPFQVATKGGSHIKNAPF